MKGYLQLVIHSVLNPGHHSLTWLVILKLSFARAWKTHIHCLWLIMGVLPNKPCKYYSIIDFHSLAYSSQPASTDKISKRFAKYPWLINVTQDCTWCTNLTVLEVQNSRKYAKSSHTAIFVFKKKTQSHFKCSQLKYLLLFNLLKENPDYESTYVFENDFPALLQDEAPSPGMLFLF